MSNRTKLPLIFALSVLLAATIVHAAWPPHARLVQAGGAGSGSSGSPIVSVVPNSYALPTTASTNVGSGVVTTTFADATSTTSAPLATTSTGTSADGSDCTKTQAGDFDVSGNTLKTSSGYATQEWDYVCVTSSPAGHAPFTQLIALKRNAGTVAHQPQHTSVVAYGDAITTAANQWPNYWQHLGGDYGWTTTARGGAGQTACGLAVGYTGAVISDATVGAINADYKQNPAWLLMVGGQDAKNQGNGGYAAYEQTFRDCLLADAAWLLIPDSSKVKATAASITAGSWSNYSTTGLASGTARQTSTVNSALHFVLTPGNSNSAAATGSYGIWWAAIPDNPANDQSATTISITDTGGGSMTASADNYGGTGVGLQYTEVQKRGNASYSVTITVTAISAHTTAIVVFAGGAPPQSWAGKLLMAGILNEQGGGDASAVAAYNADVATIENYLRTDGLDANFVPVQQFVDPTADMASTLLPNAQGQAHIARAFAFMLPKCLYSVPAALDSRTATYGITCPIRYDNGSTLATIDLSNTLGINGAAGITPYNWYVSDQWPNFSAVLSTRWAWPTVSPAVTFTGSISGTTLTVSSGTPPSIGNMIWSNTATNFQPNTIVTGGSNPTFTVSISQTVPSESLQGAAPQPGPMSPSFFCLSLTTCTNTTITNVGIGGIGIQPTYLLTPDPSTPQAMDSCGAPIPAGPVTAGPPYIITSSTYGGEWEIESQHFNETGTVDHTASIAATISGTTLTVSSVTPATSSFTGFIDDGSGHGSESGIAGNVLTITGSSSPPAGLVLGQLVVDGSNSVAPQTQIWCPNFAPGCPATGSFSVAGFIDDGLGGGSYDGVAGNVLTVTAEYSGTSVWIKSTTLAGPGVSGGTMVTAQTSGSPGGLGRYTVNISQAVPPAASPTPLTGTYQFVGYNAWGPAQIVHSEPMQLQWGIGPGDQITGTGVAAKTRILSQVAGSGTTQVPINGPGTYTVSQSSTASGTLTDNFIVGGGQEWIVNQEFKAQVGPLKKDFDAAEIDWADTGAFGWFMGEWLVGPDYPQAGSGGGSYTFPRNFGSGHVWGVLMVDATDAGTAGNLGGFSDNGQQMIPALSASGLYSFERIHPCTGLSAGSSFPQLMRMQMVRTRPL